MSNNTLNIWLGAFIGLYLLLTFLFSFFVKRFKVIGTVNLTEDKIEITDNRELLMFIISDISKIFIRINGFRGESTQLFFIAISEGIGSIEIEDNNKRFKFTILAEKKFRKGLAELLNKYKQTGCLVSLKNY